MVASLPPSFSLCHGERIMPEPKLIVVVDKLPNGKLYCMEFTPEQLEKYKKMQNDSPRAQSINEMFFIV